MADTGHSTKDIEAFLLGICGEPLATQIEEQLFADDRLLHRAEQVKHSLLERAATDKLDARAAAALAAQLERSPRLREELAQVRTARVEVAFQSTNRRLSRRWGLGLATALGTLAVVAGIVLHPSRPAAHPISQATVQPAPLHPATPATILFVPAGVLRGPAQAQPFPSPDPTRPVELQIEVRTTGTAAGPWLITLARSGETVFSGGPATVRSEGTVRYISLTVPPGLLSPGDYRLMLMSSPPATPVERSFAIAKR